MKNSEETASPAATPIADSIKKMESSSLASQAISPPKETTESTPTPPSSRRRTRSGPRPLKARDEKKWRFLVLQLHGWIILCLSLLVAIGGSNDRECGAAHVGGTVSVSHIVVNYVLNHKFLFKIDYMCFLSNYIAWGIFSSINYGPVRHNRPTVDLIAVSAGLFFLNFPVYYTLGAFFTCCVGFIITPIVLWTLSRALEHNLIID